VGVFAGPRADHDELGGKRAARRSTAFVAIDCVHRGSAFSTAVNHRGTLSPHSPHSKPSSEIDGRPKKPGARTIALLPHIAGGGFRATSTTKTVPMGEAHLHRVASRASLERTPQVSIRPTAPKSILCF
jgi:hypothetical protein